MSLILFSIVLFFIGYGAGIIGALTGLGGGVVLIPALILLMHINFYYAIGTSLICVIATSSGAMMAYLKEGFTNLRIGMLLETAAVIGAFIGTVLVLILNTNILAIIFGATLIFSAGFSWARKEQGPTNTTSDPIATYLHLDGEYPSLSGVKQYQAKNVIAGWFTMLISGTLSSLLGIGGGALKVLAMDYMMKIPYKVSTSTSNFLIGITAAASVGIYFSRGYIEPVITFPVVIGVLLGAFTGARLLKKIQTHYLRIIFALVILLLAGQMIYKGISGIHGP